jgi:hypothetical protein
MASETLHCEADGCKEYPMMWVNGQVLLCWIHYCELSKKPAESSLGTPGRKP